MFKKKQKRDKWEGWEEVYPCGKIDCKYFGKWWFRPDGAFLTPIRFKIPGPLFCYGCKHFIGIDCYKKKDE